MGTRSSGSSSPWLRGVVFCIPVVVIPIMIMMCQTSTPEEERVTPMAAAPIEVVPDQIPEAPADADPYWQQRMELVRDTIEAPADIDDRPPIGDPRVLDAMRDVLRHEFVPEESRALAYTDNPLRIGHGQTISQPYMVALMTELLQAERGHKILEIGTGSGYQAAVLAHLVDDVYSIEIVEPLATTAAERLQRLGYENVHTRLGDGHQGWVEESPFDRIIVTCAPESVPPKLVEQLAVGGRLVIPVGPRWPVQELIVLVKNDDGSLTRDEVMGVRFVVMTGGEE